MLHNKTWDPVSGEWGWSLADIVVLLNFNPQTHNKSELDLLVKHGIEPSEGLVKVEPGLLKLSTVSRYLKQWGYDSRTLAIEPPWTPFQAVHSNECWQFDFSPSEYEKTGICRQSTKWRLRILGIDRYHRWDDRSGVCYQEYHVVKGGYVMTALLQICHYLTLALIKGATTGTKPVDVESIEAVLSPDLNTLGPKLARQGYNTTTLCMPGKVKSGRISMGNCQRPRPMNSIKRFINLGFYEVRLTKFPVLWHEIESYSVGNSNR